jgi:DNA-binding NarL/FixJ family response regulator
MDIEMPVMNGIDAIRIASALHPTMKFIVLTVFDDDDKIFEAIKSGASGYLLKDESQDVLQQAISDMLEMTGSPMSPSIARKALKLLSMAQIPTRAATKSPATLPLLTPREKEILSLQVEGLDYKEIGERLYISHNTVRTHICNIYEKLHVTSKAQAIQVALKHGII